MLVLPTESCKGAVFVVKFSVDLNGNSTTSVKSFEGTTRKQLNPRHQYGSFDATRAAIEDHLDKKFPNEDWELLALAENPGGVSLTYSVVCRYVQGRVLEKEKGQTYDN